MQADGFGNFGYFERAAWRPAKRTRRKRGRALRAHGGAQVGEAQVGGDRGELGVEVARRLEEAEQGVGAGGDLGEGVGRLLKMGAAGAPDLDRVALGGARRRRRRGGEQAVPVGGAVAVGGVAAEEGGPPLAAGVSKRAHNDEELVAEAVADGGGDGGRQLCRRRRSRSRRICHIITRGMVQKGFG
ncbi:MAG: hypothetical protein EBU23_14640 [Mycobacteriaceae bacterium]|nr:hypothetical protein [Mycobacteriaceae bacterium]